MRDVARYGCILGAICAAAAGLLATVNYLTLPMIIAQKLAQEKKVLLEVLPQAERFEPMKSSRSDIICYKAYRKDNTPAGVAFKASAKGYSGIIETMVGISLEGKILAVKILDQSETPGLGTRIFEPSFLAQFTNRSGSELDEVQAIAGATISSKAVADSVKNKSEEVKKFLENGK